MVQRPSDNTDPTRSSGTGIDWKGLVERIKRYRLVQVSVAYLSVAWLVLEVYAVVHEPWGLPDTLDRVLQLVLGLLFVVTLFTIGPRSNKISARYFAVAIVFVTLASLTTGILVSRNWANRTTAAADSTANSGDAAAEPIEDGSEDRSADVHEDRSVDGSADVPSMRLADTVSIPGPTPVLRRVDQPQTPPATEETPSPIVEPSPVDTRLAHVRMRYGLEVEVELVAGMTDRPLFRDYDYPITIRLQSNRQYWLLVLKHGGGNEGPRFLKSQARFEHSIDIETTCGRLTYYLVANPTGGDRVNGRIALDMDEVRRTIELAMARGECA